ncbi:MAG: dehypoxanthine futalosine cyclase, partial [Bacteroidales bacterium]
RAHALHIPTSATMMFGHIELIEERISHLIALRDVQAQKPETSQGFATFVPWTFQDANTELKTKLNIHNTVSPVEYIRMIAISRLMLPNIHNIQASWLTVGPHIAQLCLWAGANDLGSIMIEENVVSKAGSTFCLDKVAMEHTIRNAGFIPQLRDQAYNYV